MSVTASVSELQGLAEQKLNDLSAQIDQRTAERKALEASQRTLEDAIHQLDTRRGVLQDTVDSLEKKVAASTNALTDAQHRTLTRLEQAEADATAAQQQAERAQAASEKVLRDIHTQREQVRAVLSDALDEANEAITAATAAQQAYTAKLERLLALVTKATTPTS